MMTDHVPEEVREPVDKGADPADELEVLGLGRSLGDHEDDEAGRHKRHGHDDKHGDQHLGRLLNTVRKKLTEF